MGKRTARTFKDTFWSKKRVENDITVVELANYLNRSRAITGAYLTGFAMPDNDVIKALCNFFDVDLFEGKKEFENAHKRYFAEHNRTLKARATKKVTTQTKKKETPVVTEEPVATEER